MPMAEKEFVLKHIFKNVSKMEEGVQNVSNTEEHFGIPWKINGKRNKDHLGLFLHCCKEKNGKEWSIKVSYDMKIYSVNGKHFSKSTEDVFRSTDEGTGWGCAKIVKWEDVVKDYVIDDTLNVEIHVKIKRMTGIEKKNLRNFDESVKEFSDVVLVVEGQKFYLSKLFLAGQSSYFKSLLLGNFEESKKEEVTLTGIKTTDFQNFLEALHGELSINDDNVTGILHLADMYDSKTVIKQCQEFLVEKSEKSVKEKLGLAIKYHFDNLKNKCLLEIKTIDDIRSVLPGDLLQLDHTIMATLLQKAVSQPT